MGSLQDLPHVDMMAPITKFAATVPATERVADMVSMAARECYNGAWGPSYLEIPRDVLDREIDISKAVIPVPGRYRASTRSMRNWQYDPRGPSSVAPPIQTMRSHWRRAVNMGCTEENTRSDCFWK